MAETKFKIIIGFLWLLNVVMGQFRGTYTILAADFNSTAVTNTIESNKEVSECSCDLTAHSWDISCCCDTDCPAATLVVWNADATAFCNSVIFEELKPLTKCMDRTYLAFWNDRMGITIDDNESKEDIWVTLDDRSSGSFFDEITFDTAADATVIYNRWFEWNDTSDDKQVYTSDGLTLYNLGDAILQNPLLRLVSLPAYMPSIDVFGNCDFSAKAVFGVEQETICKYKITDLANDCSILLNPTTYAGFEICTSQDWSVRVAVTLAAGTSLVNTGADCLNHMTSLKLSFKYNEDSRTGFILTNIDMTFTADGTVKNVGDVVELTLITEYIGALGTLQKSGNPGYQTDKRLLLATNTAGITLSGFRKEIADSLGECLITSAGTALSAVTENYLKFNEEINMGCTKTIANTAFATECTSTAYQTLYMFNQFTEFGRYGDADTAVAAEWFSIISPNITNAPTFNATSGICSNMITGIEYEVLLSVKGYSDKLQYYIVAINANPLQEDIM